MLIIIMKKELLSVNIPLELSKLKAIPFNSKQMKNTLNRYETLCLLISNLQDIINIQRVQA